MTFLILTLFFVFLAAFFNSVMDATENEPNFNESIFRNLNQRFWLKSVSWQYAKKLYSYKFDAWHLAKSGMICCIAGAIVCAVLVGSKPLPILAISIVFISLGGIWIATFALFYHVIFKVK